MLASLARRELDTRRSQPERPRCTLGCENPRREPRDAHLGVELRRQRIPVEMDRTAAATAFELLRVPTDPPRDRLPCDALHRIARLIGTQACEIALIAAR